MSEDKLLEQFISRIYLLQRERKEIDEKIAALELAYETLTGHSPPKHATSKVTAVRAPAVAPVIKKTTAVSKPKPKKYALDKNARGKMLMFLQERKRPVTVDAVMSRFNIKRSAANQRLIALLREGKVERVTLGQYRLIAKHAPVAHSGSNGTIAHPDLMA